MEKDFFTEQMELFFDELQEDGFGKLRKKNSEYKELLDDNAELSGEVKEILDTLQDKEKEVVERFLEEKIDLKSIEQKYIYQQAYRDCMKFLRHIHAFHD